MAPRVARTVFRSPFSPRRPMRGRGAMHRRPSGGLTAFRSLRQARGTPPNARSGAEARAAASERPVVFVISPSENASSFGVTSRSNEARSRCSGCSLLSAWSIEVSPSGRLGPRYLANRRRPSIARNNADRWFPYAATPELVKKMIEALWPDDRSAVNRLAQSEAKRARRPPEDSGHQVGSEVCLNRSRLAPN
jgi:hypothetical protein